MAHIALRVGKFLPVDGKNVFSMVKTGLAKIVFATKNFFTYIISSRCLLHIFKLWVQS